MAKRIILKVGIIGQGRSGYGIHAKWLREATKQYKIVAVAEENPKYLPDAAKEFGCKVFKLTAEHVVAVKMNLAFFERYLWDGVDTYYSLIQEAKALGLEVISDAKRCDIGSTASAYAQGLLANPAFVDMNDLAGPDAITVTPYCGLEGVEPFIDVAAEQGKGVGFRCSA